MAVSSIRRQFAHFFLRRVNEWQSLSAEDSSFRLRISRQGRQVAVSFSRRQFVPFEITNGSLLHEDSSFFLKIPQQSQQMVSPFIKSDSLHPVPFLKAISLKKLIPILSGSLLFSAA